MPNPFFDDETSGANLALSAFNVRDVPLVRIQIPLHLTQ